jgi:hydrogenase maturation protease
MSHEGDHHGEKHTHEGERAGIWTAEHLAEHLREHLTGETAVVCVGNEICGDDGAGPAVAKRLAGKVPWCLYDTQGVPESFLMKIVEPKPTTVIVIDALHFGAEVGAVELIEPEQVTGQGPSTHGPAPLAFLDVLNMFHPCRRVVLGIQPKQIEFGTEMCEEVRQAVERIAEAFALLASER